MSLTPRPSRFHSGSDRARLRPWVGAAVATVTGALVAQVGCGGKVRVDHDDGAGGESFLSQDGGGPTSSSMSSSGVTSSTVASSSSTGGGGAPSIPPLVEAEYGTLPVGTQLVFDSTANMLGFTVLAHPPNKYDVIGFEQVTAPNGTLQVWGYGIPDTGATYYGIGIASLLVPQTDKPEAMPPMPGSWLVTLGDGGDGTPEADVSIWYRQTLDGKFHGGVIDVNLFVVQGVGDPDDLIDTIEEAFTDYSGLYLGTVNVFSLADEYYEIDDGNFYDALEETEGAPGKPALNVMAIGYLGGSIEGAAGVTPGAPANPLEHGTHQSGFFWMVGGDYFDQVILRHETGHLTGLFHTSEFEPGLGDAFADTPLCPDVWEDLTGCPDFDNLMFPTGGNGALWLSPSQETVLHASALYRGIVEEGGGPARPLDQAQGGEDAAPRRDGARKVGRVAGLGAQRASAWRSDLPAAAAEHLAGIGCPSPRSFAEPGGPAASYLAALRAFGGADPTKLLAIGADAAAPVRARARALVAAGRIAGADSVALAALVAAAEDSAMPRQVRIAALHGAQAASPTEGRALALQLASDADRFVAISAQRSVSRQ